MASGAGSSLGHVNERQDNEHKNEDEQTPLHIAAKHGKTRYSSISIFHISSCCVLFLSRLGSELHKFKITMKITV